MNQKKEMIIYNLFPLLAGKVNEWEKHFQRASAMGFNWIFVNPIQKPGKSGSLYAIADYFSFNPLFINSKSSQEPRQQIKEAVKSAEKHGLKVMVDLVINHCSINSDLLTSHPQWFQWETKTSVLHRLLNQFNSHKKMSRMSRHGVIINMIIH